MQCRACVHVLQGLHASTESEEQLSSAERPSLQECQAPSAAEAASWPEEFILSTDSVGSALLAQCYALACTRHTLISACPVTQLASNEREVSTDKGIMWRKTTGIRDKGWL